MLGTDNDDGLTAKRICHTCVREAYLSAEIKQSGEEGACAYCGENAPSMTVEDLAERIETAFEDHYTRTADQPDLWQEWLLADKESNYIWVRDGAPVLDAIADAAQIPEEAAEDILAILEERHADSENEALGEESEYSPDSYYEEKGPDDQGWHEEWRRFEHSLKTQARFFSHAAADHLAQVFGSIDQLKTRDGRSLVVGAGPNNALDHLYRARVFQAEDQLVESLGRPDLHLGSPPTSMARAGRMNAQGISVFYGATEASVAISEVRPPVGSRVTVAKFRITRPLRLLDLTVLEDAHDVGSIFDSSLKRRLERVAFLQTLGSRMARAVMPDDEAVDYLPTQAVADFLATMNAPRLDGIIFPSVQTKAGRNVVLFHHAARVVETSLPEGTEIEASTGSRTDEGRETHYSVRENVPPQPTPTPQDPDEGFLGILSRHPAEPPHWADDFREAALQIEAESVVVHHVTWVEVNTEAYTVHRYREERQESQY